MNTENYDPDQDGLQEGWDKNTSEDANSEKDTKQPNKFVTFIKKIPLWVWIVLGVGVIILLLFFFGKRFGIGLPDTPNLDDEDYDLLTFEPQGPQSPLANDTSPLFFTATNDMTEQDYITLGSAITTKWADRMASIASKYDADVEPMGAGLAYVMASQPAVATERAISVWLALVDQHAGMMKTAISSTAETIADVAIKTIEGVNASMKCTKTQFTKVDNSTGSHAYNATASIKEGSNGSSALFGLYSSAGSGKTAFSTISEVTTQNNDISYVPSCVEMNLDLASLDAVLAVQNVAMVSALSNCASVAKLFPKASEFFKVPAK